MVKSNVDALGIIFPNSYDDLVPELVTDRLMASIPFASRYRMIDFLLSGMVSSGESAVYAGADFRTAAHPHLNSHSDIPGHGI